MLTLRQIEVIRAITVAGTVKGAADLLGVSAPGVSRVMKHAEAQDWTSIYLETTDGLEASMALYKRLGFEVEIAEDRPLWHGGGRFIQMRKTL